MQRQKKSTTAVIASRAFALLFGAAALGPLSASAQRPAPARSLVLDGVTVIDVKGGKRLPAQRVVIAGNRIQAVGSGARVPIPKGATVVEARDKYLIPGLWDMHMHVWSYPDIVYPLLIANGVTGIREMSQLSLDSLHAWRREILAGARVGPRIVGTGGFLSTPARARSSHGSLVVAVATTADGRRVVDSLKRSGADFIKIRSEDAFSRAAYFAIAAEARRLAIPLVGHVPDSVTPAEASDSGQRSFEHFVGRSCAGQNAHTESCTALGTRLARNGTWVVPTLVYIDNVYTRKPERLRYWPEALRSSIFRMMPPLQGAARDSALAPTRQGLYALHRLGVRLLTGSDAAVSVPEVAPGFSLHDELVHLVQVGLTPLEALQAATLGPAQFLEATDSLSAIASGKLADLVLLDADPLADIHNTSKIRAVVANGRYFDRAALDALLAMVEANANAGQQQP